jgi:hypothetical protein
VRCPLFTRALLLLWRLWIRITAPLPTSIGEDVYGGIAAMQKARVGAAAVLPRPQKLIHL